MRVVEARACPKVGERVGHERCRRGAVRCTATRQAFRQADAAGLQRRNQGNRAVHLTASARTAASRPLGARVRVPVCWPAGPPRSAPDTLARTRRLSLHRRQQGHRPVSAPLLIGRRHSDKGGRSVRCGCAGVRPGLRRLPCRTRATCVQPLVVLERPSACRADVRFIRDVSGFLLVVGLFANRRPALRASHMGGRVRNRGAPDPAGKIARRCVEGAGDLAVCLASYDRPNTSSYAYIMAAMAIGAVNSTPIRYKSTPPITSEIATIVKPNIVHHCR